MSEERNCTNGWILSLLLVKIDMYVPYVLLLCAKNSAAPHVHLLSDHNRFTMAFRVPILPHTSPLAPQPPSIKLPLHPHQLRALHRCLLVENDGSLAKDFGAKYDYRSRGGCLADAVGMGKTVSCIMKPFLASI